MKRILSLLIAAALMFTMAPAMAEQPTIKVVLDGNYIQFDVQPQLINDRTMVPVRAIFEALDATVDWDDTTRTVTSTKGDTKISLSIDDNTLYKNEDTITLDVPAKLIDKRTLVPVRAISEAYGCYVDWNEGTNTVVIISDLSTVEVLKVNDESVSAGYFNYCMYNVEINLSQSIGAPLEDMEKMWNSALGDVTFGEYIIKTCIENVTLVKSVVSEAKKQGINLSDADKQDVETALLSFRANYPDTAEYKSVLDVLGTTEESLKAYLDDVALFNKVYNKYEKEFSMNNKQIQKYLDENYIQAQHVLISTQGLDEKTKAEKRELAEQVYEFARQGMDFEKLVETYGEDPGTKTAPEGYLFTRGEMVEEFETIAFALKVGKISGVVETPYGYHIIKRVENTYSDEIFAQTKSMLVKDSISDKFNTLSKKATVISNDAIISTLTFVGI